ncbi:MAG TPA: Ig-like domain-containing protein [Longimicrobium sp.]|nr:Ig-like domain-containing protein [Longimicrobium sp.]
MTPRRPSALPFLLLLALAAACRDGAGPAGRGTVEASADSLALLPGEGATLTARVLDRDGRPLDGETVAWASSDTTVATVTAAGEVRAVRTGDARIAAASGALGDTVPVRVAFSTEVAVHGASAHVNPHDPALLTLAAEGSVVRYVARRDASGRATGLHQVRRGTGSGVEAAWFLPGGLPDSVRLRDGTVVRFVVAPPGVHVDIGGVWRAIDGVPASAPATPADAPPGTAPSFTLATALSVGNGTTGEPSPGARVAFEAAWGPGPFEALFAAAREAAPASYEAVLPSGPVAGLGASAPAARCEAATAVVAAACAHPGLARIRAWLSENCTTYADAGARQDCLAVLEVLRLVCDVEPPCDEASAVDHYLVPGSTVTLRTSAVPPQGPSDLFLAAVLTSAVEVPASGRLAVESQIPVRLFPQLDLEDEPFPVDGQYCPTSYRLRVDTEPAVAGLPVKIVLRSPSGAVLAQLVGITNVLGFFAGSHEPVVFPVNQLYTVAVISGSSRASTRFGVTCRDAAP